MTMTAPERPPEEGPDFVPDGKGGLKFEPYHKRDRNTVIADLALYGVEQQPGTLIDAPWWDEMTLPDGKKDPLGEWGKRAPDTWETRGGVFRMQFDADEGEPET